MKKRSTAALVLTSVFALAAVPVVSFNAFEEHELLNSIHEKDTVQIGDNYGGTVKIYTTADKEEADAGRFQREAKSTQLMAFFFDPTDHPINLDDYKDAKGLHDRPYAVYKTTRYDHVGLFAMDRNDPLYVSFLNESSPKDRKSAEDYFDYRVGSHSKWFPDEFRLDANEGVPLTKSEIDGKYSKQIEEMRAAYCRKFKAPSP